jgi:hypothetical protein
MSPDNSKTLGKKPLFILVVLATFLISAVVASPTITSYSQTSSPLQPSFSSPVNLSNDSATASNPDVWNVGNHVYVAWSEGAKGLMFRESPNGGLTWVPPLSAHALNLASGKGNTAPLLSANASNVYVVWSENFGGIAQIMEATSTNYGQNFSAAVQVSQGYYSALTPVIASWGNNVYVAWTSGSNSYLSCSSNAGASWSPQLLYGNAHEPEIAAWGGQYVYAVSDDSLYVSSNNCRYFNRGPYYLGSEPWISAYGPNVYIAGEGKGSSSSISIEISNNYGVSWSRQMVLSSSLSDVWAPMVGSYGNSAWIAVHTNPGGSLSEVYVYTTTNAGQSWSSPIGLSTSHKSGSNTGFPFTVVSSDGQNVFVAWPQQISLGYWQMYASYSPDGGASWTSPPGIDISENAPGTQASSNKDLANAAIASYGTTCFATWQFTSGTTNQVYFAVGY